MTRKVHARAVCEFAGHDFTKRRGGDTFVPGIEPDEEERTEEAIDLIGHDGLGPIAIEHTLIEAYPMQILDNRRFTDLFEGFPQRFTASLPRPGYYTLTVDVGASAKARGDTASLSTLADVLEVWVREVAPTLPEPLLASSADPHFATAEVSGFLNVTLFRQRSGSGDEGSLAVLMGRQGSIEDERISRTQVALKKKAPKLERGRATGGTTLLVLEFTDHVQSSPVDIQQAVLAEARNFSPLPDEIMLVGTMDDPKGWRAYPVKSGPRWSAAALDLPPASEA